MQSRRNRLREIDVGKKLVVEITKQSRFDLQLERLSVIMTREEGDEIGSVD